MNDADLWTGMFARPEQAQPPVRDRFVRGVLAVASLFALAACPAAVGTDEPQTELDSPLDGTIEEEPATDAFAPETNVLATDDTAGTDATEAGVYTQYIALGDSYSAGTGSTSDTKGCGLSQEAWPYKVADGLGGAPKLIHGACSGAKTSDVLTKQIPTVKQAARDASTLITVTVGGNDAKLSLEFIQCGLRKGCTLNLKTVQQRINQVATQLTRTFTQLKAAAPPGATIVAVGYPHLLAPSTDAACNRSAMGTFFSKQRRTDFNKAVDAMNLAIRNSANAAQIGSITTEIVSAFAAHGACSTTPWIHEGSVSKAPSSVGLAHPNVAGETAYAKAVLSALSTRFRIAAVMPEPEATPLPGAEEAAPVPESQSTPGSEPMSGAESLPKSESLPGFEPAAEAAGVEAETGLDGEANVDGEAEGEADVDGEADAPAEDEAEGVEGDEGYEEEAEGDEGYEEEAEGDDSYEEEAEGDDGYEEEAEGDDSYEEEAEGDDGYEEEAEGDDGYEEEAEGDDGYEEEAEGDDGYEEEAEGDDGYEEEAEGDDGYEEE